MNTKRFRRRVVRLVRAVVVSIAIALVLCEVGLRVAIASLPKPLPQDLALLQVRLSGTMPQYAHSPYWSPAFVNSFSGALLKTIMVPEDQYDMPDFELPGYTIRNTERLTTDQPQSWTRQVWVFGSSSVWGAFVADGWTIPSYLQREFNRRRLPWRVHNIGHPSSTIQYYWLEHTNIQPGDIVIFIDGSLDLTDMIKDLDKQLNRSLPICQLSDRTFVVLLNLWCGMNSQAYRDGFIAANLNSEFALYRRMLVRAKRYTQAHGATFFHFLQPISWKYPQFYPALAENDPILVIGPDDWFDDLHYDDDGHAKIARAIADAIAPTF